VRNKACRRLAAGSYHTAVVSCWFQLARGWREIGMEDLIEPLNDFMRWCFRAGR